jgi:CheY-like chemotaxis protein
MEDKSKNQSILVVEDEELLLALLKEILEKAGYGVFTAQDGTEAVDVYRSHWDEVALVLSDMALPKIGGWTVYRALKEINPKVKMVLASGYLDPNVRSDLVKAGAKDFIPKPYVPEAVLASIRAALDSPE